MKKQFNLQETDKIEDIFEAPEGYFQALPQRIQKRVQQPEKQVIWYFRISPKYALIIASMTILLVFGAKFLISDQQHSSQKLLSEIPEHQIRQYLLQSNIYEHELMDLYIESANSKEKNEETILTEEILEGEIDIDDMEELLLKM